MKTLRELIEENGSNGFVLLDAGNGSSGPCWIDWDDEAEEQYGDVEMSSAITAEDIEEYRGVMGNNETPEYASEWIDGDNPGEFIPDNPYRYRIIF